MRELKSGAFPPPLGWIPVGVALLLVTIASVAAFVPQYGNHQIVGLSGSNPNGEANNITGPGDASSKTGPGNSVDTNSGSHGDRGGTFGGNGTATSSKGDCLHGKNAGATDVGVTSTSIHIATTDVTTGIGRGFLGQAADGMKAAIATTNRAGGVCGRHIVLDSINDNWDRGPGAQDISGYINSGNVFALVGEPDSEGLDAATQSLMIDRAGIPVVGTDGMLKSQYNDPWIWPVAASTVTNMHIVAQYAVRQLKAARVGIVYDNVYKFGAEGAAAFKSELTRLAPGKLDLGDDCAHGFCGVSPSVNDYSSPRTDFNNYCSNPQNADGNAKAKCDVVVMLLEPQPMQTWMSGEENCNCVWFNTMMGGEPLFDEGFADGCGQDCASMVVWTGYKPAIEPFDAETPVYTFANALRSECSSCDTHNEFTEGAYLGTELFITACERVGADLTRAALKTELDTDTFDLGLALPLHYGTGLPHLANSSMVAYRDNAAGTFNGWSYLNTGFVKDPDPGKDL